MDVVAVTRLGTSIEAEAKALAADLGALPYEQRMKLQRGMPAVVLATPDAARARAVEERLRARGHDVIRFDTAAVVASDAMIAMRWFRFEPDGILTTDAQSERLRWADIAVIVRAAHRTSVETSEVVLKKQLAPGRALLTGGLIMNKTTAHKVTGHTEDSEAVLYLMPRTAGSPWLLREQRATYGALGTDVTASSIRNFELVVDRIRTSARQAAFDDRLVARKGTADEVDLLVHVVASTLAAGVGSPFR